MPINWDHTYSAIRKAYVNNKDKSESELLTALTYAATDCIRDNLSMLHDKLLERIEGLI